MESAKAHLDKAQWFENIHASAPEIDWREIERTNMFKSYEKNLKHKLENTSKDNTVNIADGLLVGEWNEKGSNNLSGSIVMTDFDERNNMLYAIAAGGSLWRYDMQNGQWEVINEELRFDSRFLEVVYPDSISLRIICSINGKPYFSDSGLEWTLSSGPQIVSGGRVKNVSQLSDGKHILYLVDEGHLKNVKLYHSENFGQSFKVLASFNTSDLNNLAMDVLRPQNELHVIEQITASSSKLLKFDPQENMLSVIKDNSPHGFGPDGRANLRVRSDEVGNTIYFSFDNNNVYKQSVNMGNNWDILSTLPVRPWDDGVFVSFEDPQIMIISEVNAYISKDGGRQWNAINEWHEYYGDPVNKLHADMMHIDEYMDSDGPFITIANHGGINVSYDKGLTNPSIAQFGLNISQYYSVRTYPADNNYFFAGSQDQGIQRSYEFDEGTLNFTQMFSGDYGHICFSKAGQSMWTVYPGGWVFYFDDPVNRNNASHSYQIESQDETVWLPPMIKSPYSFNGVLIAGGDKDGGPGSHVIELKVSDFGNLQAKQWPFDFKSSGGTITGMCNNRFFSNVFYVITSNGKFYRSNDSGATFEDMSHSLNTAHYLYGHDILASPSEPGVIYIAGSGYSNPAVYQSNDGGNNFFSIQNNLPPTTVFDIDTDPEGKYIFAATEAGPYVFVKHLNEWFDMAQGIAPNQTYWSVEYLHGAQKVRFGSYGRGVWDLDIGFLSSNTELQAQSRFNLFPNPVQNVLHLDFDLQETAKIKIINSSGHEIYSKNVSSSKNIDVSAYPNGMYYLIFETRSETLVKKFIKI